MLKFFNNKKTLQKMEHLEAAFLVLEGLADKCGLDDDGVLLAPPELQPMLELSAIEINECFDWLGKYGSWSPQKMKDFLFERKRVRHFHDKEMWNKVGKPIWGFAD